MTSEQSAFFGDRGYLLLTGALKKAHVQAVREHVLQQLQRMNIWAAGKTLSGRFKDLPAFQQITRLAQSVKYPGLQQLMMAPELIVAMQQLADAKLVPAQDAQLLLSLPRQGDWTLQGLNWHLDISAPQSGSIPGVQMFVLIDDLASRGGATLALAGSHKLTGPLRQSTQKIHQILENNNALTATVAGVDISVLEMTGRAGDVYLMDMRVLHAPSFNATRKVRMMATARFLAGK